jgi:hypothetical protein
MIVDPRRQFNPMLPNKCGSHGRFNHLVIVFSHHYAPLYKFSEPWSLCTGASFYAAGRDTIGMCRSPDALGHSDHAAESVRMSR